jgi:2'-5' RNA ligase
MSALRLFLGLGLPGAWHERLAGLEAALRPGLRSRTVWPRPGNGHVTLRFLGAVEEDRVAALGRALGGLAFAPFALGLAGAGRFPPRGAARVLWVGVEPGAAELAALAAGIDAALAPLGFGPRERPYRPHLTLCRVKADGGDAWDAVLEKIARVSWPVHGVDAFTLWRSVPGPDGPKYTALAGFGATSVWRPSGGAGAGGGAGFGATPGSPRG